MGGDEEHVSWQSPQHQPKERGGDDDETHDESEALGGGGALGRSATVFRYSIRGSSPLLLWFFQPFLSL